MSGHTPGPWRFKEWGSLIVGGGEGSSEILICSVAINTRRDEGRHNAVLIEAAPDMLEALQRLVDCYSSSHSPETRESCWAQAKAAIKKATT